MSLSRAAILIILIMIATSAYAECEDCRISESGVNNIRLFEGFSPVIYKDSGGLPTIGYGHLILPGEKFPVPFMGEPAENLLMADIRPKERDVNRLVTIPMRQPQFDALTSFTFNVGGASLAKSTLLRKVNAEDDDGAVAQFGRWVYVKGQKIRGLELRRAVEAQMYMEPEDVE